jgi:uncharacterized protein YegP (UPF0339 family)
MNEGGDTNMRFKLSEASNGQTYFELQADGNHETLATSETYARESDALAAIELIKREAGAGSVVR